MYWSFEDILEMLEFSIDGIEKEFGGESDVKCLGWFG